MSKCHHCGKEITPGLEIFQLVKLREKRTDRLRNGRRISQIESFHNACASEHQKPASSVLPG